MRRFLSWYAASVTGIAIGALLFLVYARSDDRNGAVVCTVTKTASASSAVCEQTP